MLYIAVCLCFVAESGGPVWHIVALVCFCVFDIGVVFPLCVLHNERACNTQCKSACWACCYDVYAIVACSVGVPNWSCDNSIYSIHN